MNKKILAMLLALAMIISVVPMTAMAEEHEHDFKAKPNGDGTHTSSCNCGLTGSTGYCEDGTTEDGFCDKCGYKLPEFTHEHNFVNHPNNDGTHTSSCNCGLTGTTGFCEDGTTEDGFCDKCGYKLPEFTHEHNFVNHPNNDGTHTSSCNCGLTGTTGFCEDGTNVDGKCDKCGYNLPPVPSHDEHNFIIHDNGNGTHTGSCACGAEQAPAAHTFGTDGFCACGALCTHEFQGWVNKGETHDVVCRDCGLTLQAGAAHVYENTYCACGAHEHDYVASRNDDKTHDLICVCGGKVENLPCSDGNINDGKCDTCGNVLYEIPDDKPHGENDHEWTYSYNNDGTHSGSCKCGATKDPAACADANGDGKCDACAHVMPVAPAVPDAPAKVVSTAGLDNVPKTGCAFVEWLYALIFG